MNPMDFIPWIGMIVNATQSLFGDSAPDTAAWTISGGSTVASFAAARAILTLSFWDDVVAATATRRDDWILKGLRQILAVLAAKRAK